MVVKKMLNFELLLFIFECAEEAIKEYGSTGGHRLTGTVHYYDLVRILRMIRCDIMEEAKKCQI